MSPFKTFTAGETLTASDVNTYLAKQAVIVCTSGTRPSSPVDGMVVYETDTDKFLVYDGTNWLLPDNIAGGALGRATTSTDQNGVGTSLTDLTGLSVTVTAGAGRPLEISGQVWCTKNATASPVHLYVIEAGAIKNRAVINFIANASNTLKCDAISTPGAGSVTYKLQVNCDAGTVDVKNSVGAGIITVKDIGAA